MIQFGKNRIMGMAELQKLSFKKLKRMKLRKNPLLVMDLKTDTQVFVVLEYDFYENLIQKQERKPEGTKRVSNKIKDYDFRSRGLFWDCPSMTNKEFISLICNPDHSRYSWAVTRLLERLRSQEVLSLIPFESIGIMIQRSHLRKELRKPWEEAIDYWNQKTSRPRS